MKRWSAWEITRRQVAIGGRVLDARGQPVPRALVTITTMPEALRRKIGGAAKRGDIAPIDTDGRGDVSHAAADGVYYFLDLPDGLYTLRGSDPRSGAATEGTASVTSSQDGKVHVAVVDLQLSNAGVRR